MKLVVSKKYYLSEETKSKIITDKNLIKMLTKKDNISELRLYLDNQNQFAVYEADVSGFCILYNDIFYNHAIKILKELLI